MVFGGFDRRTLGKSISDAGWTVAVVRGAIEATCKTCEDARVNQLAQVARGW